MPEVRSYPCFLTPGKLNPHHPLFVFLPGMDGTGQLLRTQTSGLEHAFDVRCLAIPPDDLASWDELTDQVVALIQAELEKQPTRSVYLCGESFGGCLAMKVAVASPDLFDRIILINPASSFNQQPLLLWGSHLTGWVPQSLYQGAAVWLLPFLANLGRIHELDRRALLDTIHSVPHKTIIWRLSLIRDFHVDQTQLRRLTQPVLVIAGGADQLLPSIAEAQHLTSLLANAKIIILPHSGHACLLEEEVNLFEIMKAQDFLERRDKASLFSAS